MDQQDLTALSADDSTYDHWGLECRLSQGDLEFSVPDGFAASAAHNTTVGYIKQIGAELVRLPHRYGYDPGSSYHVLVQTWDRARLPLRSLAFGRKMSGHEKIHLIPDPYYIASAGYSDLHELSLRLPPWSHREAKFVWRGSVTGQGPFASIADIPRVKLALLSRDFSGVDVALTGVHETMRYFHDPLQRFLENEGLLGSSWPLRDFSRYRFAVDIDGHANAWGLLEKLILGCCVLKVDTPFEQWYYDRLHAWEHYIPIAGNLSDLGEKIQWCRENDGQCRWISENGMRLAATLRLHAEIPRSCLEFMKVSRADFVYRS